MRSVRRKHRRCRRPRCCHAVGGPGAETVYEFATACHEDQLNTCFNLIRDRLDRLKAKEQGRAFCLPRAWGTPGYITSGYSISVLEHIRLSVSAARFGKAEEPVDIAMRDILKAIYPCE